MEKKNFLFVSIDALIHDTAWTVYQEGHEVKYFIGNKKISDIAAYAYSLVFCRNICTLLN